MGSNERATSRLARLAAAALAVLATASGPGQAQSAEPSMLVSGVGVRRVVSGLVTPIGVASIDASSMFVIEKNTGKVQYVVNGVLRSTVLDLAVGGDSPLVTLELEPSGAWVAEAYPVERVEVLADGRLRVELRVGGRAWLERLLLRLGPAARVVAGPDDLAGAGRAAAARVLERYR